MERSARVKRLRESAVVLIHETSPQGMRRARPRTGAARSRIGVGRNCAQEGVRRGRPRITPIWIDAVEGPQAWGGRWSNSSDEPPSMELRGLVGAWRAAGRSVWQTGFKGRLRKSVDLDPRRSGDHPASMMVVEAGWSPQGRLRGKPRSGSRRRASGKGTTGPPTVAGGGRAPADARPGPGRPSRRREVLPARRPGRPRVRARLRSR